ncbi:MAG: hypothetical protein PHU14_02185 [Methylovulum sp.]|nr:hypothetical protein [Methylovulum sp.]
MAQRFGEEKILYDKFHEAEFADADLAFNLPSLYKNDTDLIVAIFCPDYEKKQWCGLEWRAIFSMIKEGQSKKILLSHFELVDGKGLFGLAGFIDLDEKKPEQLAALIIQRLAINEGKPKNHYANVDANEASQARRAVNQVDVHHKNLAARLLKDAPLFFQALQDDFASEYPHESVPASVNEMVDYFAVCLPEQVQDLFFIVRRSLEATKKTDLEIADRTKTCAAACALYCLAAIRLVDKTANEQGGHILQVPRSESVICAIIATALFGGQLRLPLLETHLPRPEFVFDIRVGATGDHFQVGFERALYTVLFENSQQAYLSALDTLPLTHDESKALAARLRTIKNVKRECLALIVHGYANQDSVRPITDKHQIPVMFPSTEAATIILGMEVSDLLQEIREFWQELNQFHQPNNDSSIKPGTETMTNPGININASGGTVVFSTGAHSAAQAGTNNTANTGQQQLADFAPLTTKLNELQAAIAELSSVKAKDTFTSHLQTVQSEIADKDKPDVGIVKKYLEAIKQGSEVIEGGEKIVELCSKALPLLSVISSVF